jgi:hypothetical protein
MFGYVYQSVLEEIENIGWYEWGEHGFMSQYEFEYSACNYG